MKFKLSNIIGVLCLVVLGFVLWIYLYKRAYLLPATHDEVQTSLTFAQMPVWRILYYTHPIPNNHILNTLLVKLCQTIGGINALTIRLPNLFFYWLYFLSACIFARVCSLDWRIKIFAFSAFLLNPYLLDFFSLARGYALSIDFMLAACLSAYFWLQTGHKRWWIIAIVLSCLSVYSNFTSLHFYMPFFALLGYSAWERLPSPRRLPDVLPYWKPLVSGGIVLGMFSIIPLLKITLTHQLRFWETTGFYKDTLGTLVTMSLYGKSYLFTPEFTAQFVAALTALLICFMGIALVWNVWQKRLVLMSDSFTFFFCLLLGSILVPCIQFWLLKTPLPTTRTALFYYPLLVLPTIFFLEKIRLRFRWSVNLVAIPLTVFVWFHFANSANMRYCMEWEYDANTKIILRYLEKEYLYSKRREPITLESSWWFHPSLTFHIQSSDIQWLDLKGYHMDACPTSDAQFYYASSEHFLDISPYYETLIDFDGGKRRLLKKRVGESLAQE